MHILRSPIKRKKKGCVLISETFAAVLALTRFCSLARAPEKRARVPSSARVPGVAHPCSRLFDQ